ncbi:hypothetical protein AMS68_004968 [Peltaster fructicola]|uniref:Carboxypeptidase n=1 Tax=Peltaster fructicola TaxID=286661 RepID=A0A6H0XXQ9_9PEZI|nr:hypothetical protein AMS68_004968 [Peltaster fructicola]
MMMDFFRLPPALSALLLVALQPLSVSAQYPPAASYSNTLNSQLDPRITISYKQPPAGTCMTAYTSQKQYTGYITLPPYTLAPIQQNYTINTFFWFVEARQSPEVAPLTIWLNGGPGTSSMFGLFNEVGPCEVVQTTDGNYGTQSRRWGWDRSTNILFIDQPNQVGFSYDRPTNASFDLFQEAIIEPPTKQTSSMPPFMYLNGTFGTDSQSGSLQPTTANTTEIAAQAVWHFLQTWLSTFSQYNPATRPNMTVVPAAAAGVHLFTESYGGKYGPVMASFFEHQNALLANGTLAANSTIPIQLETVGIVNGLIDDAIQDPYYPLLHTNNTYGIQAINQADQLNDISMANPNGHGDSDVTNKLCQNAQLICYELNTPYYNAGYNPYDIRQKLPTPDPPAAYQEYLNNGSVLAAIGARINFTESNSYVQRGFISTGDTIRGGQIEDLAALLSMGVRVALIYGDSDYVCNWYGGQAVSLAIANQLPSTNAQQILSGQPISYAEAFPRAGYAEIVVNASYVGGSVRQYGNLSFSRIYDAGHMVPYYQPETAFTVFTRIIYGTSIATGQGINLSNFSTSGPANTTKVNNVPPSPITTCWVRAVNSSCTQDDISALLQGKGVVAHGVFYQNSGAISLPTTSVVAGVPGMPTNSTTTASRSSTVMPLTGVYTATATPTPTGNAAVVSFSAVLALLAAISHIGFVCS